MIQIKLYNSALKKEIFRMSSIDRPGFSSISNHFYAVNQLDQGTAREIVNVVTQRLYGLAHCHFFNTQNGAGVLVRDTDVFAYNELPYRIDMYGGISVSLASNIDGTVSILDYGSNIGFLFEALKQFLVIRRSLPALKWKADCNPLENFYFRGVCYFLRKIPEGIIVHKQCDFAEPSKGLFVPNNQYQKITFDGDVNILCYLSEIEQFHKWQSYVSALSSQSNMPPPLPTTPPPPLPSPSSQPSPFPSASAGSSSSSSIASSSIQTSPEKDTQEFSLVSFMKDYLGNRSLASPTQIFPSACFTWFDNSNVCQNSEVKKILEDKGLDIPQKIGALKALRGNPENFAIFLECTTNIVNLLGNRLEGKASHEISKHDLIELSTEGHFLGLYISKIGKSPERTTRFAMFILELLSWKKIDPLVSNAILHGAFSIYNKKYDKLNSKQLAERFKKLLKFEDDVNDVEKQIDSIESLKIDFKLLDNDWNWKFNNYKERNQELLKLFSILFYNVKEIFDLYRAYSFAAAESFENATGAAGGYDPSKIDFWNCEKIQKDFYYLYNKEKKIDQDSEELNYDPEEPNSGWKIHINASNEENMSSISRVVVPYLFQNHIWSKVSGSFYHYMMHIQKSFTQRGKFITAYANNYVQAKKILNELIALLDREGLSQLEMKKIRGDLRVIGSNLVFIRYGNFKNSHDEVTLQNSMGDRQVNKKISDSRHLPFPEFIWKQKAMARNGDERFFSDIPLQWKIPGTTFNVSFNSDEYSSWNDVLEPSKIFSYVKQSKSAVDKFLAIYEAYCREVTLSDPSPACREMVENRLKEIKTMLASRLPSEG